MAFKIKDGLRIGTVDVFNNSGTLLVNAPTATKIATAVTIALSTGVTGTATSFDGSGNITIPVTSVAASYLSGTIPSAVLGNSNVYLGTSAIALNRASGALSLAGVSIDGSAGSVANTLTFNTSGGAAAGSTFNGSAARTIDYSTVGAAAAGHNHSGTYEPVITSGTTAQYWRGDKSWQTLDKTAVGLSNVENTALSTWAGSSNITTIGAATATSLVVTGNLTVNGTTTTVNSTVVTIDDPVFTLGGDTAPATDDGKDRGIEFRWHNGTAAKIGFFGFDDSTGKFTFIPDATNASEVFSGTTGELDAKVDWANILNKPTVGTGSVTSVALTVPTGLTVSGSPITTSGTLAITLTSGYSIPTTASQTNWDSAYTQRLQWDGGSTNLVAATGRTSLGATTVGSNLFTLTNPGAISFLRLNADNTVSSLSAADFKTAIGSTTVGNNLFTLTNPSAITFLRVNADNTVSALDAATFRTAIGAGTSSTTGTVTSVSGTGTVAGLSLSGTVTTSGNITLSGTLSTPVSTINDSTTVGQNLVKLTNPSAITFLRVNADNTISTLDAATFRTAIGAQASGSYLTAESDTLATVTGRGATTATALSLTNTTDTTSTSTGALIVSGGIAVTKNILIAGKLLGATSAGTVITTKDEVQATVATVSTTQVDSWAIASYRSAKYIVQITQGSNYQVSEIMIIHNGTTTTMTEFAVLETNGALATFTSDINTGNARLLVTMGSATSATINIQRVVLAV